MGTSGTPDQGALLLQLGTPEAPTAEALKEYLGEFLMDPSVIDLPFLLRFFLVKGLIVPRRAPHSAAAYQTIWRPEGSPLRIHTENLVGKVGAKLGPGWKVAYAMRYGRPSISDTLEDFSRHKLGRLRVLPLYPQFAEASFGSSVRRVLRAARKMKPSFPVEVISPYFADEGFMDTWTRLSKMSDGQKPDFTIFTFHGLPERHLKKTNHSRNACFRKNCCAAPPPMFCYRAQCYFTAKALASRLGFGEKDYVVSFQSRLGRDPWLTPNTEDVLKELGAKRIGRLKVVSPSFAADCLETIEELGVRGKEIFTRSGGGLFEMASCPNAGEDWVKAVSNLILSGASTSLFDWGMSSFSKSPLARSFPDELDIPTTF